MERDRPIDQPLPGNFYLEPDDQALARPRSELASAHDFKHWSAHATISQPMRVLEYSAFDPSRFIAAYRRIVAAIEGNDFRAADIKKLENLHHGKFYRAKLDHSNRLLFALALDDQQQSVYESLPPLIVVGGAGSGKTALTLEKMKCG